MIIGSHLPETKPALRSCFKHGLPARWLPDIALSSRSGAAGSFKSQAAQTLMNYIDRKQASVRVTHQT